MFKDSSPEIGLYNQQKMSSDYILNLMENNAFPDLPSKNVMVCNVNIYSSQ
jgi:hypothetical protein